MTQCERLAAESLKEGILRGLGKGIETYEPIETAQDLIDEVTNG